MLLASCFLLLGDDAFLKSVFTVLLFVKEI